MNRENFRFTIGKTESIMKTSMAQLGKQNRPLQFLFHSWKTQRIIEISIAQFGKLKDLYVTSSIYKYTIVLCISIVEKHSFQRTQLENRIDHETSDSQLGKQNGFVRHIVYIQINPCFVFLSCGYTLFSTYTVQYYNTCDTQVGYMMILNITTVFFLENI
jgi:hypothetical protein